MIQVTVLILKYGPAALRAAKVVVAVAPHAVTIYRLIKNRPHKPNQRKLK